jgi:hypothetical protein
MSSTHNKHRRDETRRVISPSYLIGTGPCRACKQPNHDAEYCPTRRRKKFKAQMGRNSISSVPQFLVPQQIFYDTLENHPAMPTQQDAMSQYFIMNPPFPFPLMTYGSEKILKMEKPSDIPDLDFPSLAVTPLSNCLLNSPLELNATVALPSILPDPPPHEHISQYTSQKSNSRKCESTPNQHAQPPTKTPQFPCTTTSIPLFNSGEGNSYFDEATWSDQFGHSFPSINGGQTIWSSNVEDLT